ncbi:MAG TPA: iron-siderophore ABC transporter substrate-binding protein [Thermoleophilaceae bacterium]|nr:iron-siderophore ABC transporter substrate-binding protein [Thermoleophilaceae bacterium]
MRERPIAALAAALITATAVAGCTDATGEGEDEFRSARLHVAHAQGDTYVPGRAERVITLTPDALDAAVALGVVPIGAATSADGALPSYLPEAVSRRIRPVGPAFKLDIGAIKRLDAEVIVGTMERQGTRYGTLNRITPTVMTEDTGHSWEVNTRLAGEAFGRTDEAETLLIEYDRKAARLRRELAHGPRPQVSVVRVTADRARAAGAKSFAGTILGDAGLPRPPAQQADRAAITPSVTDMSALDGDLILLSAPRGGQPQLEALMASPDWQRLRAVRAGRVHRVADDVWGAGGGLLAADAALRDLRRLLAR